MLNGWQPSTYPHDLLPLDHISMIIKLNRDSFAKAVGLLSHVTSSRSAIQAVSGIHFKCKNGTLELEATDLEIGMRITIERELSGEFGYVLPARLLSDVVRSLPAEEMELGWDETAQVVSVKCGAASFDLRCLAEEDFPKLPTVEGEPSFSINKEVITETIERVSRSSSTDETRPILTSVQVVVEDGALRMVATDSYRLSVKQVKVDGDGKGFEANVPARSLQELVRVADQVDDELAVYEASSQIVFKIGDVVLTTRVVDGQFPNYKQLIPESFESELKVDCTELLGAVKRVGLMAQKNTPLKLTFAKGSIKLSARTPDVGSASEEIPAPYEGDELEIGFNPQYLKDGLDCARSKEVKLKMISQLRPVLIESEEGEGYSCLVMPVRVQD